MKRSTKQLICIVLINSLWISCADELPPEASFTFTPESPLVGDTVFFANQSKFAEQFSWNFGDGINSNEENPYHIYSEEGTYEVTMEAGNESGLDLVSKPISVEMPFQMWRKEIVVELVNLVTAVSVDTADIDGDGDLDIVVPLFALGRVDWYENKGDTWAKHTVKSSGGGPTFAYCTDVNMDNRPDVVAVLYNYRQIVVYLNKSDNTWETFIIEDNGDHPDLFVLADINGDQQLDVVTAGSSLTGGDVVWYENQHPIWTKHTIEEGTNKYASLSTGDYDNDGKLDVSATMNAANQVVWFKQGTDGINWSKNTVENSLENAWGINSRDVNGDGKMDILATAGGAYNKGKTVVWYENQHPDWLRHEVDNNLARAGWVDASDIDEDGLVDIVASGYRDNNMVWYQNAQNSWIKNEIARMKGPRLFYVTDFNKDGLQDIIVAYEYGVHIYYQNPR